MAEAQWLTFDADEEGKLTSSGWKRRYGRLELWRFDNDYWSRPGGNPHVNDEGKLRNVRLYGSDKAALHKDKWDAEHAIFDARQRTSETAVYGYGAGGAPNDSPSPKGIREQLLLVLSRRLADPATLSTLPRLVSALRGQLWAKFSEYVEERVDILECHWACDDALIDEIQAKVMRANIDSEYGKSVDNPAEWEHSLDYFWDFHGPNPNPTTGYQADY